MDYSDHDYYMDYAKLLRDCGIESISEEEYNRKVRGWDRDGDVDELSNHATDTLRSLVIPWDMEFKGAGLKAHCRNFDLKDVYGGVMPINIRPVDPVAITPCKIWQNGSGTDSKVYTTVEWADGSKTTVCCEDPEKASLYSGFTAALAKKIFGTGGAIRALNVAVENTGRRAREKKEDAENRKKMRKINHEHRILMREEKIKLKMEQIRIENEAKKRLLEESRKEEDLNADH